MKDILLYGALIVGALAMGQGMIGAIMGTADNSNVRINTAVAARAGQLADQLDAQVAQPAVEVPG